jgi:hypothetical protein
VKLRVEAAADEANAETFSCHGCAKWRVERGSGEGGLSTPPLHSPLVSPARTPRRKRLPTVES